MTCATLKRPFDWESVLEAIPSKRRRSIPFCGMTSMSSSGVSIPSVFPDVISRHLTPEAMAANIRAERRRFQKRKQQFDSSSEDSGSGGEQAESPLGSEKSVFTFKQVGLICERILRDKEAEIRQEYDHVLTIKLAEQHDAFVKFTYDQIQNNYSSVPSYLS